MRRQLRARRNLIFSRINKAMRRSCVRSRRSSWRRRRVVGRRRSRKRRKRITRRRTISDAITIRDAAHHPFIINNTHLCCLEQQEKRKNKKMESLLGQFEALAQPITHQLLLEFIQELKVPQDVLVQLHSSRQLVTLLRVEGSRTLFFIIHSLALHLLQLWGQLVPGNDVAVLTCRSVYQRQLQLACKTTFLPLLPQVEGHSVKCSLAFAALHLLTAQYLYFRIMRLFQQRRWLQCFTRIGIKGFSAI